MKKTGKGLLIAVVVLAVLVGGFVFSPLLSMSVKKSIEHFGSKILQTEVSVGGVGINVLKGNIDISDLAVANPEGFKNPSAFMLGSISIDVDMKSLRQDVVVINSIIIDSPQITLEKGGRNLKTLMSNLDKPAEEAPEGVKPKAEEKPGKKLIISNLTLQKATVNIENKMEVTLPNIFLKNLGSNEDPASIKEVVAQVLSEVTADSLKALAETGKQKMKEAFKSWLN